MDRDSALLSALSTTVETLTGSVAGSDALVESLGKATFVLLGEATHGTAEFYRARADLSQRLIEEHGFAAIAVEGDWPDALRIDRFVRGESSDGDVQKALAGFLRFPSWMWNNVEIARLAAWLRAHNASARRPAGFYGLDLYSLHSSVEAVLSYLRAVSPEALDEARRRYACFEPTLEAQTYGRLAASGAIESCAEGSVQQLLAMQRRLADEIARDGGESAAFHAVQNARVVTNAERYYRTMYRGGAASWNLRDRHMVEMLLALQAHLSRDGEPAKIVVWAHNTHLGDARATQMALEGELNLGQLLREQVPGKVVNLGFTTYRGTVTAADGWDEPPRRLRVREALPESYEALFHRVGPERFLLDLRQLGEAGRALSEQRLERAIGVVYRPQTERWSHYFDADLPAQFDFVVHEDKTTALEPLVPAEAPAWPEAPETYPTGM